MSLFVRLCCILGIVTSVSVASAATITATITADNHYALYTGTEDGASVALIGGNELGAGGAPGTYNWSAAETYSFSTDDPFVYLAAWSDDRMAQGLLTEITVDGITLLSGDLPWTVFATGIDQDDGDPYPTETEMSDQIALATWEAVAVGDYNGVGPWGTIDGISASARWMWHASAKDVDALNGGYDHDEYLVFRASLPEPSSVALLAAGGIATIHTVRRRRG